MPLIEITAAQGTLNRSRQDALVARISDAVLIAETADPDDPAAQSLVWAHYSEASDTGYYVGGKALERPPLVVAITTPQGALTAQSRKVLVESIGKIVNDLVGPYEGRLNHWAMLYELDEGSWAGAGQIFPLAKIQAAMNIEPRAASAAAN